MLPKTNPIKVVVMPIIALLLLVIAIYFYAFRSDNKNSTLRSSNTKDVKVAIPTYTPTPTPDYKSVMTNNINGNKYTPLTSLIFWDKDFRDEVINTVNNGPRYARRAKVEKGLDNNILVVEFDDGQSYRLFINNDLKMGAPIYTYDYEKKEILGYEIKLMNESVLNYLSPNSTVVVWFYEKSLDVERKTITPYELLIADIK